MIFRTINERRNKKYRNIVNISQREAYLKAQTSGSSKPNRNRTKQEEFILFDSSKFNTPKYDLSKDCKIGPQPLNQVRPDFTQSLYTPFKEVYINLNISF